MTYIERLNELRKCRNIKQAEIAEILNCQQAAVSKYERGELRYKVE